MNREILLTKEQSAKLNWQEVHDDFLVPANTAFAYRLDYGYVAQEDEAIFVQFMNGLSSLKVGSAMITSSKDNEFASNETSSTEAILPKGSTTHIAFLTETQVKELFND